MSETVTIEAAALERLRERVRTLSQEKAHLQLVTELLTRLSHVSGLDETARALVAMLMDIIGGSNVALYYQVGDEWRYCDAFGAERRLERLEGPVVVEAFRSGRVAEAPGPAPDGPPFHGDWVGPTVATFAFPLKAGERVFGVLEMDGVMLDYHPSVKNQLQLFLNYAGLALCSEILNHSKLKAAYDDLKARNEDLRREIAERHRAEKEARELEAQLRQVQKLEAVGQLAGGIAHDFNNILGAILGYAELAQDELAPESEARSHLAEILTAAERARDLVGQILAFSRKADRRSAPLDLARLVAEALRLVRATIPTTIAFETRLDGGSATVLGDPTQLHQVVVNLCTNAAHAMEDEGGTLSVSIGRRTLSADDVRKDPETAPGDYVVLEVRDTGCGIPADIRERVFDPFFTTKAVNKGTGMGLSVVLGIVRGHGGTIEMESEEGRGTTVRVLLPQISAVPAAKGAALAVPRGNGERVLLVDDEPQVANVCARILERFGYRVEAFGDPRVALGRFCAAPDEFDVVVTDQTMPHMTGLQLVEQLRARRADIPVVLCTGFSAHVDAAEATRRAIDAFTPKPLGMSSLARSVRRALDGPAAADPAGSRQDDF